MPSAFILLAYAFHFIALLATARPATDGSAQKPIIIDTDIFSDVDDIGALAVANALHNCGLADLRGVVVNTDSRYGSLAASTINTYYSNPKIPIAALRPLTNATFTDTRSYRLSEYASKLAHNYPRSLQNASSTPEPVALYRSLLASAPNSSLTIISIGFLTNLAALLRSEADKHSLLSGTELAAQKIAELVVMGGAYPSGSEWNFISDAASAASVVSDWPRNVPITFSGYELGKAVFSGQKLAELAEAESPVLAAYQWYGDRCNTTRASYDPVTVLYGILGLDGGREVGFEEGMFEFANEGGYNEVKEDGTNAWVEDGRIANQHWLNLRDGVREEQVGELLTRLYAQGPEEAGCWFERPLTVQSPHLVLRDETDCQNYG